MAEEMRGSVVSSIVETDEPAFVPGVQVVAVVMRPTVEDEPYLPQAAPAPYIPEPSVFLEAYVPGPKIKDERIMVFDIETTGLKPWESRIINIGCVDAKDPSKVVVFMDEDEEKLVADFMSWFIGHKFTKIYGYNTGFDYRFIFAKCLRYGIIAKEWAGVDVGDIMAMLKKVKETYLDTTQPAGTLDEWSLYLLGKGKDWDSKELLERWERGEYDEIRKHVEDDVMFTYKLWQLIMVVKGEFEYVA